MSRRRKNRPQPHRPPAAAAPPEVFSEQELDFFRRGDELHTPVADANEAPDSDA